MDDIQRGDAQTAEAEQVRAQAMLESRVSQLVFPAIQELAEIEDLRGKYF